MKAVACACSSANCLRTVAASGVAYEEAEDADVPLVGMGDTVLLDALDGREQAAGAASEVRVGLARHCSAHKLPWLCGTSSH